MGGDLFAIHWDAKTKALTGINASGWAPKRMTLDALRAKGRDVDAAARHHCPPPCPAALTAGRS